MLTNNTYAPDWAKTTLTKFHTAHCPKPQSGGAAIRGKQGDLILTPCEFIAKIAALVPPPRTHLSSDPENSPCVVISHDCDLAQAPDKEPKIEIIVGKTCNGNHTHAKNSHTLHLPFTASNGDTMWLEFPIRIGHL